MGGRTKEFKCQGECRTDWRDVWERSLRATTRQHLRPANSNGSEIQDDPDPEEPYWPSIECHFCRVLAGPFWLTPGNKEEFL
jgi:hypothetical protein